MAKKTNPPPLEKTYQLDRLPAKFGNVSIGPERCTIGVMVDRSRIELEQLESAVCGAMLEVRIVVDPAGADDTPGQGTLVETEAVRIESVAESPSLNVKPDALRFRLSFSVNAVEVMQMAALAQKSGHVSLTRIGNVNEDGGEEE